MGDACNHSLDVRENADAARYAFDKGDEAKARECVARVQQYTDRLVADLSTLDYITQKEREEKTLIETQRVATEAAQTKLPL